MVVAFSLLMLAYFSYLAQADMLYHWNTVGSFLKDNIVLFTLMIIIVGILNYSALYMHKKLGEEVTSLKKFKHFMNNS